MKGQFTLTSFHTYEGACPGRILYIGAPVKYLIWTYISSIISRMLNNHIVDSSDLS